MEGFDGGLPQGFILELVETPTLRLARNLSISVIVIDVCAKPHKDYNWF